VSLQPRRLKHGTRELHAASCTIYLQHANRAQHVRDHWVIKSHAKFMELIIIISIPFMISLTIIVQLIVKVVVLIFVIHY